jgi:hypothetical protein
MEDEEVLRGGSDARSVEMKIIVTVLNVNRAHLGKRD